MADQELTIVKSEPLPELTLKDQQSDSGALAMRGASAAIPSIAEAATEFATSPVVPRIGSKIGRVVGGIAPIVGGYSKGGLGGAAIGMAGSSTGAWAGGKTGWFTAKMLQNLAEPAANALNALAPYAQAINTVSGAQGVLDLAQMADATRKDIATLGVSLGETRSDEDKAAHPALINAIVGKVGELASSLKNNGIPAAEATAIKLISDGNAATFGKLMTLYMRSRSVKP